MSERVEAAKKDLTFVNELTKTGRNKTINKWSVFMDREEEGIISAMYYGYLVGKYGIYVADTFWDTGIVNQY